jgi:non-heme chloroperoxidase
MNMAKHETGRLQSADVSLFYRLFRGPAGRAPLAIFHGANYYDSSDWVDVAGALAQDRDVLVWDARGFGQSGWSADKDYSYEAYLGDARRLLEHFGWRKAVITGHSIGGSYALLFAARIPEHTAALVLIDHCPQGPGGKGLAGSTGNTAKVYASVAAAMADSSRFPSAPGTASWESFATRLRRVEGGFITPRDPDFSNRMPLIAGWKTAFAVSDMWQELKAVRSPALVVRGTRSDRYQPEALARLAAEHPGVEVVAVEAGHDVAGEAPQALVSAVRRFLDAKGV